MKVMHHFRTSTTNNPEAGLLCLKKKKIKEFFRNAEKRLVIYGRWKDGGVRREVDGRERM